MFFRFWNTNFMDSNIPNQSVQNEIPVTHPNLQQQPVNESSPANNRWKSITYTIGVILSMNISFLVYTWTNGFVATSIAALGDSPLTYFIYLIVTPLISIFTFVITYRFFRIIIKREINSSKQADRSGTSVMQLNLQESANRSFSPTSKWKNKRYLYALLYGIPGFFLSIPLFFVSSISMLFICSPMDPHNFCSEHPYSFYILTPLFFLPWWLLFIRMGYIAGKKLEVDRTLNKKHVLISAGITALFILIIVIFLIIPIGGMSQIKNLQKLL